MESISKKKILLVQPNDFDDANETYVKEIESSLLGAFRDIVGQVQDSILSSEELHAHTAHIADTISLDSLVSAGRESEEYLEGAYSDAGDKALGELDITDEALFDLVHTDAKEFAADRAAELVGKKLVGGKWIDNPDANWAITETTREDLRAAITAAYENSITPAQFAKQLEQAFVFSQSRAKMIARTETAKAAVQGTIAGWKRSGMVEGKSSLLSDDHDQDDECNENEDDGVIPLDAEFSSGDDGPPFHPNCNCGLVADLIPEEEEET